MTGATGFVGGALARALAADGWRVRGTGRDPARLAALARDGVAAHAVALDDVAGQAALLGGVDVVVHCAARAADWGRRADFVRDNVEGTRALLGAVARAGVPRLVHISTASVYFTGAPRFGLVEADALDRPPTPYPASKRAAERLVLAAHALGAVRALVVRPRGVIGRGDVHILPRVVAALRAGRLPRLDQRPVTTHLTTVGNLVHACRRAMEAADDAYGAIVHVADPAPIDLWPTLDRVADGLAVPRARRRVPRALVRLVAGAAERLARGAPLVTRYGVSLLSTSMTLDCTAARARIGYAPPFTTEDGIAEALA